MKLSQGIASRAKSMPGGSLGMSIGLVILGITSYLFVLIAGRVLGDERYAPLGALWVLVFLITPGFFYPIEQETARAVAARRSRGEGIAPLVRQAAVLTAGLTGALALGGLIGAHYLNGQLFNDQAMLTVAFITALIAFAMQYLARGIYSGNGALSRYGILIATEGTFRVIAAVILVVVGVRIAGPYGMLVGLAPFISVVVSGWKQRHLVDPGPPAKWKELSSALGLLIAASMLSQVLVNSAPLVVKYLAGPHEQALSGAFTLAVIITRSPLFLFQAIQAVMLPKLTRHATEGNFHRFAVVLREISAAVFALGVMSVIGSAFFGSFMLEVFGSDYPLPVRDFILLATGSGLFLLCITIAQALVALRGQSLTVFGWASGVASFVAGLALPMDLIVRVEIALLLGSGIAFLVMLVLLFVRLRKVSAMPELVRGDNFMQREVLVTEA